MRYAIIKKITALRHALHQQAELSGREKKSVALLADFVAKNSDFQIYYPRNGGLIAWREDQQSGQTLLFRADLDAVRIAEDHRLPYHSLQAGISHKCGHDGHSAILGGLAAALYGVKTSCREIMLVFQPAEETGKGAKHLLSDSFFKDHQPDQVLALHNIPGYETGSVIVRKGCFALASTGLEIKINGISAHASTPHLGKSPAPVLTALMNELPAQCTDSETHSLLTVTHAALGRRSFGIAPADATLCLTLRSGSNERLSEMISQVVHQTAELCRSHNLDFKYKTVESFPATINDSQVAEILKKTAQKAGFKVIEKTEPFSWSEDFGYFTAAYPGLLFGLGSGSGCAPLHHPDYDFPDELLSAGIELFRKLLK